MAFCKPKPHREAVEGQPCALTVGRIVARVKTSRVPPGGWRGSMLYTHNGRQLIHDMIRAQRAAVAVGMRKLIPPMTKHVDKVMREVEERVADVYRRTTGETLGKSAGGKTIYDFNPQGHEDMWMSALDHVLKENQLGYVHLHRTAIQSAVDAEYGATAKLLWTPENARAERMARGPSVSARMSRASGVASRITGITQSSRNVFERILRSSIGQGHTVAETASWLRSHYPKMERNRISTIARTEISQAADEGRKQALKDVGTVTHVSVIGCEAREPHSPQYNGESTCNIEDVPIGDMDQLVFHINHTGTIVPSRFAGEEEEQDAAGAAVPAKELLQGGADEEKVPVWLDQDDFRSDGVTDHRQFVERNARDIAEVWEVDVDHLRDALVYGYEQDLAELAEMSTRELKERGARLIMDYWAASSGMPEHIMVSQAINDRLGQPTPLRERDARIMEWVRENRPQDLEVWGSFGNAMYDNTQAWFKERGITEVRALRAGAYEGRPITSWSTNYGGVLRPDEREVFDKVIPVEYIMSNPATGFGTITESEYVLANLDGVSLRDWEAPDAAQGGGDEGRVDPFAGTLPDAFERVGTREYESRDDALADKEFVAAVSNRVDKLTEDEFDVLRRYSESGYDYSYAYVNKYLRDGELRGSPLTDKAEMNRRVLAIDRALEKSELPVDMKLYRGTGLEPYGLEFGDLDKLEGKILRDRAFTSASIDRGVVTDAYASSKSSVIVEIDAKRGTHALPMFVESDKRGEAVGKIKEEAEVLFPLGTSFRVTEVDRSGDIPIVRVVPMTDTDLNAHRSIDAAMEKRWGQRSNNDAAARQWDSAFRGDYTAQAEVKEQFRKLAESQNAVVCRAMPTDDLARALEDGRIKTQFETGKSHGSFDPDYRKEVESNVLGVPEDTPNVARPVYGFYASAQEAEKHMPKAQHSVMEYGGYREDDDKVVLIMRDSVHARTTFVARDSFGIEGELSTSPLNDVSGFSLTPRAAEIMSQPGAQFDRVVSVYTNYSEIQIWDGLPVKDIERVVFSHAPSPEMEGRLKSYGIGWSRKVL